MPRFKIQFDHYEPGCGCGCVDNDLNIAEQNNHKTYRFSGTRQEAEQEVEMLRNRAVPSYGNYWTLAEDRPSLVVISGPSGVGKGPIIEWLKRLYYPELLESNDIPELGEMKGRKNRTERHTGLEADLGFEGMSNNNHEYSCRGSKHAIDLDVFDKALMDHDAVIFETYHTNLAFVKSRYKDSADIASVFISPLTIEEMNEKGRSLEDYLPDLMLNALVLRAKNEGKSFTRSLLKELLLRAEDSVSEMESSPTYDFVLPNHCYESDSRWKGKAIEGEPKRVVDALHEIILGL